MKKLTLPLIVLLSVAVLQSFSQNFQWAKKVGGALADKSNAIAVSKTDDIYITGTFNAFANFNMGGGMAYFMQANGPGTDIFVAKYHPNGDLVWAQRIGGAASDVGRSIVVDTSGNCYITGEVSGTVTFSGTAITLASVGQADIFIAKYGSNGTFLWAKNIGSVNNDAGYGISVDPNGNPCVTGTFSGTTNFGIGYNLSVGSNTSDIFVAKYSTAGNIIWAKNFGNNLTNRGCGIVVDHIGNLCVTGEYRGNTDFSTGGPSDTLRAFGIASQVFVSKFDPNGNHMWARPIGGSGNDSASSIAVDINNNVYATGNYLLSARFSPVDSLISNGGQDIYYTKFDTSGILQWVKGIGGTSNDKSYSIYVDADTTIYLTGSFSQTVDFNPDAGNSLLTSFLSTDDIYFAHYLSDGSFDWAEKLGELGADEGRGIAVDKQKNILLTGSFSGRTDFDPSPCRDTLGAPAGYSDGFIGKYANHPPLSICMATVDSSSTYATLVWEKPPVNPGNIDSFYIYREIDTVFTHIGSVAYDSLSTYKDYSINPNQNSYVYKIAVLFSNGTESPKSNSHETMYLQLTPNPPAVNLMWNDYCGFPVSKYYVWRDTNNTNNFVLIDSVGFGNNVYIDTNPPTIYSSYRITTNYGLGCNATRAENYQSSLSNRPHAAFTVGIANSSENKAAMDVIPNPSQGTVKIILKNINDKRSMGKISVSNLFGQTVYESRTPAGNISSILLDLSSLAQGVYTLQWSNNSDCITQKLLIKK